MYVQNHATLKYKTEPRLNWSAVQIILNLILTKENKSEFVIDKLVLDDYTNYIQILDVLLLEKKFYLLRFSQKY